MRAEHGPPRGGPIVRKLVTLVAASLAAASLTAGAPAAPARTACGPPGYAYAGLASPSPVAGAAATLSMTRAPEIESGHIAGWIGVGGPGLGENGVDAWIQVGMSALPWSPGGHVYVEVKNGDRYRYQEVGEALAVGEKHRLELLEVAHDHWQVRVDGVTVIDPVHLPASHGAWQLIATGESWDGGEPACNRYGYRFEHVRVLLRRGGAWRPVRDPIAIRSEGYRLAERTPSGFVATVAQPTP